MSSPVVRVGRTPKRLTTACATFEITTTAPREADERDAGLHRRVVKDILEVERQEEELRERDCADDRHGGVSGGQRAQPKDPQRQQGRRRAQLDRDERDHERDGAAEKRERRSARPSRRSSRASSRTRAA